MLRIITLHYYYLKNWKNGQCFNYLQILCENKIYAIWFPYICISFSNCNFPSFKLNDKVKQNVKNVEKNNALSTREILKI